MITIAGNRVRECIGGICQESKIEMRAKEKEISHLHVSLPVTRNKVTKSVDFTLRTGREKGKSVMKLVR